MTIVMRENEPLIRELHGSLRLEAENSLSPVDAEFLILKISRLREQIGRNVREALSELGGREA